ncbi:uncharacterized protein LOC108863705, partial [Galendromus occidentalis]|uniref:Uncharacterized protein LOC108863705 n=1 Tax=Galendromus occidentalis TaxID=34638 RepID=A0AAJ7L4B3_9ACAR
MEHDIFEDTFEELPAGASRDAPRVSAVSLKLPPFWPKQATVWFTTVEAQFSLRRIVDDQTKFEYALTALDSDTQERVGDFFDDLPAVGTRYSAFKARVLDSFKTLPSHVRDLVVACDHLELRDVAKLADKIYAQRQATSVLAMQYEDEVDS